MLLISSYSTLEPFDAGEVPVAPPDAVACVASLVSGGLAVALSVMSESLSCWRYEQHAPNIHLT